MDRRYTFSSALPFVAYEATKCMRAPGSWVLVLKWKKWKYCNFNVLTPKIVPIIRHVFYHYHYIFQVGHKSVTLMLDGLLFLWPNFWSFDTPLDESRSQVNDYPTSSGSPSWNEDLLEIELACFFTSGNGSVALWRTWPNGALDRRWRTASRQQMGGT
jgi:hypothetical protein